MVYGHFLMWIDKSRIEGLAQGADAYLTKPFHREELEVRLKKLIEVRQKLQACYHNLSPETPAETSMLKKEDKFLRKIREIIEDNLSDENFGGQQLVHTSGISRSQLHRKLHAVTGKSASRTIRSIRLEKAKELIQTTDLNISEVAYAVGYANRSHFSQDFKKGMTGSELFRRG